MGALNPQEQHELGLDRTLLERMVNNSATQYNQMQEMMKLLREGSGHHPFTFVIGVGTNVPVVKTRCFVDTIINVGNAAATIELQDVNDVRFPASANLGPGQPLTNLALAFNYHCYATTTGVFVLCGRLRW